MLSLHSHSGTFCQHAHGALEEVIQRAIELGFETYGLSEHVPRTRERDLYPEESHLSPSELTVQFNDYYETALALRQKYSSQISLLIGAETEFIHAESLSELQSLRTTHPLDYVVGSIHHVHEIPIDFSAELYLKAEQVAGSTEQLFQDYFDAQYEVITRIQPMVIGHFDLVRIFRPDFPISEATWTRIRRNVDAIVKYAGLVEINARGFKKIGRAYPGKDILTYMQSQGCRFTLSDDSHGPKDVGLHYDRLWEYLKEMDVKNV
ncbi:Polymerase/histidinol phosphatase-like protein, partial [Gaertneriomyces semiglobifer]